MKLGTRPQIWFAAVVAGLVAIYVPYRLWSYRDITWHWHDEALLSDGTRVWISRTEVREIVGGGQPFSGPSRGTKLARLELPGRTKPVVWEARMEPMIVERGVDSGQWIVIASPIWCDEFREYGSPTPSYVQFEYVDESWRIRHVDKRWIGRKSNLLLSDTDREKHNGGRVTAEQIPILNYLVYEQLLVVQESAKMNCVTDAGYRKRK